jgi:hypothetical protein
MMCNLLRIVLRCTQQPADLQHGGVLGSAKGQCLKVWSYDAQEGGLGEDMKVHKSQLERDRETALTLLAARKKAGHNPLTPYPVKVCRTAPYPQSIYLPLSATLSSPVS